MLIFTACYVALLLQVLSAGEGCRSIDKTSIDMTQVDVNHHHKYNLHCCYTTLMRKKDGTDCNIL